MWVGPRAVRGPPGVVFPRSPRRTWKRFNVIRIRIGLKRLLPRAQEHGQGSLFIRSYRWRRFFPRAQTRISAFCARTRSMRSYLLIMPGSYYHRYRLALHRRKNTRTWSLTRDKWQCTGYGEANALHTVDRRWLITPLQSRNGHGKSTVFFKPAFSLDSQNPISICTVRLTRWLKWEEYVAWLNLWMACDLYIDISPNKNLIKS